MPHLVETSWLADRMSDEDLRILDCHVVFERAAGNLIVESGRSLWSKGHIPGSTHVDLVSELSDTTSKYRFMMPPPDQIGDVMSRHGVSTGTRVVLYDRDKNMWAARVWWMLRAVGFDDAAVLNGGWVKWTAENRPISIDPSQKHPAGAFVANARADVFVGQDQVLSAISDADTCLVNALGESEHWGQSANYGRRGHIPTAVNVPATTLTDPQTHGYLDQTDLRARMAPVLESGSTRVISYCGGGISASSAALVLSMLGWENVSIYDGSMSEWCDDPSLPLTLEDR